MPDTATQAPAAAGPQVAESQGDFPGFDDAPMPDTIDPNSTLSSAHAGDADFPSFDDETSDRQTPADGDDAGASNGGKPPTRDATGGTEPSPEPGASTLDELTLREAEAIGIPRDVARRFGSRAALEGFARSFAGHLQSQSQVPGQTQNAQAPPQGEPEFEPTPFALDEKALAEQLAPEAVTLFKGINDHYAAQTKSLHAELKSAREETKQVIKYINRQTALETERKFDAAIAGFDPAWESEFGKGSFSSLDASKQPYQNREKLMKAMHRVHAGYLALGENPPELEGLAKEALLSAFPDKVQDLARASLRSKVDHRQRQGLQRPGSRPTSNGHRPVGREAAQQWAKERGHSWE